MSGKGPRPWQVVASREVYSAEPYLSVQRQSIRLPDGCRVDDYHHIALPDFCIIFAETPGQRVIIEHTYKHGTGKVGLTLPAGGIDRDEEPLSAARRELLEETGYTAEDWRALGRYTMNGNYGCGHAHLFHARGARHVAEPDSGDLEEIEVRLMSREALLAALGRGEIDLLGIAATIALVLLGPPGAR